MQLGILVTGDVPEELVERHGSYPEMFERLLGAAWPELRFRRYRALDGELPETPADCDAWLVTGSKHGVYDDLPWIAPLRRFLAEARQRRVPIVGICFGHQILAQALGGEAEKSERGWGIGVRGYEVLERPSWMADAPGDIRIHAWHQDQVVRVPGDATVLARNDHCPYAMLAYGDPERPDAISIQPHPEFTDGFARDLVEARGAILPPEKAREALESHGTPIDADAFARWCVAYLRRAAADARAA